MNSNLSSIEARETFFMALYIKAFSPVARHIAKMGGTLEEAQDIFQDALVIYYEKVSAAKPEIIVNEKAYLLGVARNIWLQRYKVSSKNQPLADFDAVNVPDEQLASDKIMRYLQTAGKKCLELLKACYYDHLPVGNLAAVFGYSSTHSATVAKYKCLEKVRETVKQNSLNYADFIE
ncbi:DNA-directed RNA polymerase specialized sigma subunit, sigma24 family [Pedobacter westerhofensis]|uniref:DNA-directed RNA polymerase specialized sigma subunit, sigma24 family n=1 Tax=Pedobacter westerhofensis TaxID=425512 RepID=A0A521E7Q6_9SPHI|nr:sigma-70 family RNA polymerase sigma factor [Pedobacter westerhofensis]SMO79978.1 DNA-directed RNA polymerase specialized sigma subunit, sigma24 family [Pedobacter westerhofensis]